MFTAAAARASDAVSVTTTTAEPIHIPNPNPYNIPEFVPATRPLAYSVEMTDPPSLLPRTTEAEEGALSRIGKTGNVVLLGIHSAVASAIASSASSGVTVRPLTEPQAAAEAKVNEDVLLVVNLLDRMHAIKAREQDPLGSLLAVPLQLLTGKSAAPSVSAAVSDNIVVGIAGIPRTPSTIAALERYFLSSSSSSTGDSSTVLAATADDAITEMEVRGEEFVS